MTSEQSLTLIHWESIVLAMQGPGCWRPLAERTDECAGQGGERSAEEGQCEMEDRQW